MNTFLFVKRPFFCGVSKIYDLGLEGNGCLVNIPLCLYREMQMKPTSQLNTIS